jgi:hypothetical protein
VTGEVLGSTTVSVYGSGFKPGIEFLKCQFGGSAPVFSTFITSTELRCISPPQPAGFVALEISNNNQDYTTDAVPFTYQRMSPFTVCALRALTD